MAPRELQTFDTQYEARTSRIRVAALASRQCGRVSRAQLHAMCVPRSTIDRWIATGYLIRVLRGVYAVGHSASDERARLFSLILFAGPSAMLSHGTSAHRRGWLRYPVAATHISTPRRIRTRLPGVVVHCSRDLGRELVNGVPCTTVVQTLLDLAATEPPKLAMRALAQLDYERKLRPAAIRDACGRGKPGSAALLRALGTYIPAMARTRSDLEDDFLLLCQEFGVPIPEVNAFVHGIEVDCHWPRLGLVVELDGEGNHGTAAQRNRDQRNALKLRAHGLTVIRYSYDQVTYGPASVAADVWSQIDQRRRLTS